MIKNLLGKFYRMRFRSQLNSIFALALFSVVVSTSAGTSWLSASMATDDFNQQCSSLIKLLARQSKMAIFFGSEDSAKEIADSMLTFAHVLQVTIRDENRVIYSVGDQPYKKSIKVDPENYIKSIGGNEFLTAFNGVEYWEYSESVIVEEDVGEFGNLGIESVGGASELIGHVDIVFSTRKLNGIKNNIIAGNIIFSVLIAFVISILLSKFNQRITNPLQKLSAAMGTVASGGVEERAELVGPYELRKMSGAFNQMMNAIDTKNKALVINNQALSDQIVKYEVAELERKKLEKQLRQAHKMEAIGQLTGGIAHDFNNILGSIIGFTGLTISINRKPQQSEKIDEYLKEVMLAGERARKLVEQLLAFSRESYSKPEVLAAKVAVRGALKLLESTTPSTITVRLSDNEEVPNIMMDLAQLEQVVMNLCINAIDAIGDTCNLNQGEVNVDLERVSIENEICSSCQMSIDGDFVQLTVNDNGAGIAMENLEHLFEPFYTTKGIGEGTGLGLSMAHGIVHEHGGHIVVNSTVGVGTSFKLLFRPIEAKLPILEKNDVAESLPAPVVVKNAHILLVDDDTSLSKFVGLLLEGVGYQVSIRGSADEALNFLKDQSTKIDLILTDQAMPKMTGLEMSKVVLEHNAETPIILYTGYDKDANQQSCDAVGIRGFLKKPLDSQLLLTMIGQILSIELTT